MAKRKPDRIDRAAASIAGFGCVNPSGRVLARITAKAIAALVRREVRRAVKEEHASLRAEIARLTRELAEARSQLQFLKDACPPIVWDKSKAALDAAKGGA